MIGVCVLHCPVSIYCKKVDHDEEWDSAVVQIIDNKSMMAEKIIDICAQNLRIRT